jgi:cytochrome c553
MMDAGVRGDLSAPTCSTCHGNHGATPPGVAQTVSRTLNCDQNSRERITDG